MAETAEGNLEERMVLTKVAMAAKRMRKQTEKVSHRIQSHF